MQLKSPACQVLLSIPATAAGKVVKCPRGKSYSRSQRRPCNHRGDRKKPFVLFRSTLTVPHRCQASSRILRRNIRNQAYPRHRLRYAHQYHTAPQPSTVRKKMTLVAVVLAAFTAAVVLLLSVIHSTTTGNFRQAISHAVVSLFPNLIAVACLSERYRTLALRIIAGVGTFSSPGL